MTESDIIKARLNVEEMKKFNELKQFLNLQGKHGEDARTIKAAIECAHNVTHGLFGGNLLGLFVPKKSQKDRAEEHRHPF